MNDDLDNINLDELEDIFDIEIDETVINRPKPINLDEISFDFSQDDPSKYITDPEAGKGKVINLGPPPDDFDMDADDDSDFPDMPFEPMDLGDRNASFEF